MGWLPILLVAAWLGDSSRAHAQTNIVVGTFADDFTDNGNCSLREAIEAANTDAAKDACPAGSGTDTITLAAGTYTLSLAYVPTVTTQPADPNSFQCQMFFQCGPITTETSTNTNAVGDLQVLQPLVIVGAGRELTIIDADDNDRAIRFAAAAANSIVRDLGLRNGDPDAPYVGTALAATQPTRSGGLVLVEGFAAVVTTFERVRFEQGSAAQGGGLSAPSATVSACIFADNTARTGGGAYGGGYGWSIRDSLFTGNTATDGGGGFAATQTGGISIERSTFTDNDAAKGGGIMLYKAPTGAALLRRLTVFGNRTTSPLGGAGLYVTCGGTSYCDGDDTYIEVSSSILAYNTGGTAPDLASVDQIAGDPREAFNVRSVGYNLLGQINPRVATVGTDQLIGAADPLLDSVKDVGDPVPAAAALDGSLALDHGLCGEGDPAPLGADCDVGAHEGSASTDFDGDGLDDDVDPDDDNDGVLDGPDGADLDPERCQDLDTDGCDDCAVGTDGLGAANDFNPANDGTDTDLDGFCDVGDLCAGDDATGDSDGDETCDDLDACDGDATKIAVGLCGCGVADTNTDGDAQVDCNETCDTDPSKTAPGICGCGVADTDTDGDATADCEEDCDSDPNKTLAGICGCGVADTNTDGDLKVDCEEDCDSDPNKTVAGICGCGVSDADSDQDGTPNCNDACVGDNATGDADDDGICNDRDHRPLVATTTFSGAQGPCTVGGVLVQAGIDEDGSATLTQPEITSTAHVCNGVDGTSAVVGSTLVEPGETCPAGGVDLALGTDTDRSGGLSAGDSVTHRIVCSGQGLNSLIETTALAPSPTQCPRGGTLVESGLDDNDDGVLADDEVDGTQVTCNGTGLAIRTTVLEPGSEDCPVGGRLTESGVDDNGDGELGDDEVQNSDALCEVALALFDTETLPEEDADCPHGGVRVKTGHDDGDPSGEPANGTLESGEVEVTRNVCLAPTDVLINGGSSGCSVAREGDSRTDWFDLSVFALGAWLLGRRRRASR